MKIKDVPIEELNPSEYNPRALTEKEYKDLKESLKRFDFVEPIVVNSAENRKNIVIGGHQRLLVAKEMGYKMIPVSYVKITKLKKEQELNLRLNKNLGHFDYDLLANFDEEMLIDVGFNQEDLDDIFKLNIEEDKFNAEDEYEKIKKPKTKLGDLYRLGNHYLFCGDAKKREDVEILMNKKLGKLVFTDPPYNVNYDYGSKFNHISNKKHNKNKNKFRPIVGDKVSKKKYIEFLEKSINNMYLYTSDNATYYIWYSIKWGNIFYDAIIRNKWVFSQTIIWIKDNFVISQSQDYNRMYESCMHGWKEGHKHYYKKSVFNCYDVWNLKNNLILDDLDIWKIKRDENEIRVHPTQKPIKLAERALRKSSVPGDIVIDLFGGSGSTLMACEQLNRQCYIMDIDPICCDLIIKRWEDYVDKKAVKVNK